MFKRSPTVFKRSPRGFKLECFDFKIKGVDFKIKGVDFKIKALEFKTPRTMIIIRPIYFACEPRALRHAARLLTLKALYRAYF